MKRAIRFIIHILIICCFLFIVACTSYSVDSECDYYNSSSIEEINLTFKLVKIA